MAVIQSGATTDLLTVDATSKAARQTPYDSSGNVLAVPTRGAIAATAGGVIIAGADHKVARAIRADDTGTLRTSGESLFLYDNSEGAAYDSNKWVQTITTSTVAQAALTGMLFNANSTLTATTGAVHVSHRQFPWPNGSILLGRWYARPTTHFANGVIELGFGAPASPTALTVVNGAHWRKDTGGQWLPVVAINGTEYLGTPISNATFIASVPVTDYAMFTVELRYKLARFCIFTQAGVLVHSADIEWTSLATGVVGLAVTHIPCFMRQWNNGAVATAVQLFVKSVQISLLDVISQRDYRVGQSGMNYNSLTSPTVYTQAAQHTNSADPAAAVLSNTTPSYTTLGGLFIGPTPTPAGAVTDFALFAWTCPAPFTFYVTGAKICVSNRGVIVATTATVLEWFLGFNASSGSLASAAPYAPMRVAIGRQAFAIGAAIDAVAPDVVWTPGTPLAVQPGRTLIVGLRIPVGTATAAGFLRGMVAIDGFYE